MKYAYDKGFKKAAINMPFSGLICKLSHRPLEKMLDKVKIPKDITIRNFSISGYHNKQITVKEVVPENPSDTAILVLHGGGFGYKTSPHQLLNAAGMLRVYIAARIFRIIIYFRTIHFQQLMKMPCQPMNIW